MSICPKFRFRSVSI